MIGRMHSLLAVISLAFASAATTGCAVEAGNESEESSLESETAPTASAEEDAGEDDSAGQAGFEAIEHNARTIAARDTTSWGQGHPPPIPWHERTEASGEAPESFDETPHPPAPSSPSDGR